MRLKLVISSERGVVYDLYLGDSTISEYQRFIENESYQTDEEFITIESIADRLRSKSVKNRQLYFRQQGNFRSEDNRTCENVIAIPDSNVSTGLRLFCLLIPPARTLIFVGSFDKAGWEGSYQSSPTLGPLYSSITDICARIESLVEYGDLVLADDDAGFVKDGELLTEIDLTQYEQ